MTRPNLFISYARADHERVQSIVDVVRQQLDARALPIEVWMDVSKLQPGDNWLATIEEALASAIGFLFFVTPHALKSSWVYRELQAVAAATDKLLIPVILDRVKPEALPLPLQARQWIDLSGSPSPKEVATSVTRIVDAVERAVKFSASSKPILSKDEAPAIAATIAKELRSAESSFEENEQAKASVFVVHGHSRKALEILERFLHSLHVTPVLLSRQRESAQSLFQKFMAVAAKAKFAVVLLGADDYGASRRQYNAQGVGERALQFRARQNVILELGFFYGRLGWENVFVVYENPEEVFPNFERPSDLDGVIFDSLSEPEWQENLQRRLSRAGLCVEKSA